MGRRKSISDDEVLAAAERMMVRMGPVRFTLAAAAEAAGLSPATLMQRFGDKRGLILRVLQRSNTLFADAHTDDTAQKSFVCVTDMLCDWAKDLGDGTYFSEQLQWLAEDTRDAEFQRIAQHRFRLMRTAIAMRLPETIMPQDQVVALIEAQWHGILVRWGVDRDEDLQHRLRTQLNALLGMLK